ncbi:DUF1467 family protein [Pseudooceanicola sp. CBS1P-1]|uniref:DUF1467 family protein n=1 Tax=Pseudooceanicola albus TaxID=2692189 RepID=A0A6L7G475_9RHOB|nr:MULTISPECIES: DUF1467 family protein [Pseudooceanicola]MBT9384616.1 DUF1467 family protein [Pseudooceanicola endophyticus]MXN18317.1 DUF1467 family protein [Pseudooceanicola albus]
MGPTSAIVLYAVIWWMTLFCVAPLRLKTQQDLGQVTRGTPSGAPEVHHLKEKLLITTGVATVIFLIAAGVILSGVISVRDLDWFGRMPPD